MCAWVNQVPRMRHVHIWVTNRPVPRHILFRVSHVTLSKENRGFQDVAVTPLPHLTPFRSEVFPVGETPLGVDPFKMPWGQICWITWYLLMHSKLHLYTVVVVHLNNIEPYAFSICAPNCCILGVWFMVQTQIWFPDKLRIKLNQLNENIINK